MNEAKESVTKFLKEADLDDALKMVLVMLAPPEFGSMPEEKREAMINSMWKMAKVGAMVTINKKVILDVLQLEDFSDDTRLEDEALTKGGS